MEHSSSKSRLTMKEAAFELRHSYSWMHANHRSLGLKGYRIGGRWYFDRSDLELWENSLKGAQGAISTRPSKRKADKGKLVFA